MRLSIYTLKDRNPEAGLPQVNDLGKLPEKVLQFGTGVLLRGLPDYFINKANQKGLFNGRVVVVKSTNSGDILDFGKQDNLYTICVRGIENGKEIKEDIISSCISRVLSAATDWEAILDVAGSEYLKVILSNTTEVGIQLVKEDIRLQPPVSFPAKLLAVLYERFKRFNGAETAGLIVIATELIENNGKKLENIVKELAIYNQLEDSFIGWLNKNIVFCNSLVDRIVPGKPDAESLSSIQNELGYTDSLLTIAEPYRLWAIEGDGRVEAALDFALADEGVIIKPDIELYRELKVRLLNGSHTLASGIACLSGIRSVKKAMDDQQVAKFIKTVMLEEIGPSIPYPVPENQVIEFSESVMDRFSNPFIDHFWINITAQYSSKLKIRVLPVLDNHYKLFGNVPLNIAFGFAAFLAFTRPVIKHEEKYYGLNSGVQYLINDENAAYFYDKLKSYSGETFAKSVLGDSSFWGIDLNQLKGFCETVESFYTMIGKYGMEKALEVMLEEVESSNVN